MSRVITAMFDNRADADAAKARLSAASIDVSHVNIVDQSTSGASTTGDYSTTENQGFWGSLKHAFLPAEDRHTYEEGVRRGGYLLTATVGEHEADHAVEILDNANSVDIDGRTNDWKKSGWDYKAPADPMMGKRDATAKPAMATDGEQRIPIVEEALVVGKREVGRGNVRVRSYVVETPVSEQVSLRDENVSIDRRPVTGGTVPEDAFRERVIEMTESREEAVVSKDARVVEEVVIHKDVKDRTETVSDTVRRTEVEVDHDDKSRTGAGYSTGTGTTGAGMTGNDTTGTGMGTSVNGAAETLGDKVAGYAKEATGSVTNNDALKQEGAAQVGKTTGKY